MRTTFDIADHLLIQAKQRAIAQHTSVKSLVEEGLRRVLLEPSTRVHEPGVAYTVPVVAGAGGLAPGLSPTDSSQLLELSESDPDA
jgi:hypothetical protein